MAHYAKNVLSAARGICIEVFMTINNPDSFFEPLVHTYSIEDALHKWKHYRDQLDFGIIDFYTKSRKYKILKEK